VLNQSANTWWTLAGRHIWMLLRPMLAAYLLVIVAVMMLETWLVYPAPPVGLGDWNPTGFVYEDVRFESADGTKLSGWYVPHPNPKRAILYCHGNGEHIAFHVDLASRLRDALQASVFLFDYRGYGQSEGRPTEAGCIADGRAAQHWLASHMGINPDEIVLMGRSLGAAVAVALAAEEGAQALVLENVFPTMPEVAALHYPWMPVRWLMDNQYDCISWISRYRGPILQSHGTDDELIPRAMARRLFDAAITPTKQWIEFPALGHNSPWPLSYYAQLAAFLDGAAVEQSPLPPLQGG
jgi:uncharacterized protein